MIIPKSLYILILLHLLTVSTVQSQQKTFLKVKITEENSEIPTPVRVKITDSHGNVTALPKEAISIMYGRNDRPERYSYQPDSAFYFAQNLLDFGIISYWI